MIILVTRWSFTHVPGWPARDRLNRLTMRKQMILRSGLPIPFKRSLAIGLFVVCCPIQIPSTLKSCQRSEMKKYFWERWVPK